jgi:hypothetical protein
VTAAYRCIFPGCPFVGDCLEACQWHCAAIHRGDGRAGCETVNLPPRAVVQARRRRTD